MKSRAPRNRTLTLSDDEKEKFRKYLLVLSEKTPLDQAINRTICQDNQEVLPLLPDHFVDLLILDPPYNLDRVFGTTQFRQTSDEDYTGWIEQWIQLIVPKLKLTASVYICGDWRTSPLLYFVLKKYFIVRNRITWEREKGRGAKANWKNNSEDIWFCTVSNQYTFHVDAVKLKRQVIAPYRNTDGKPKDWDENEEGNYRLTHPSNLWTDISVPFWSMPENTDHPTQKPEKLIAKLVLASSTVGDIVLDPFLGSGTTSVVAKKLQRNYLGIELEEDYCCLAEKRLEIAALDDTIQGYSQGVFWERNTLQKQMLRRYGQEASPDLPRTIAMFDEGSSVQEKAGC